MGHRQLSLQKTNWKFRHQHGGILRQKRLGRGARPLSSKDPLHLVFKANIKNLKMGLRSPKGHALCLRVSKTYARRFHIKIEQQAVCRDHIHILVRLKKRSLAQHFFRVAAGQIAQRFESRGMLVTDTLSIWKYRPYSRVVRGWRVFRTAVNYVRLNEFEAAGKLKYQKERLRGLSSADWELFTAAFPS